MVKRRFVVTVAIGMSIMIFAAMLSVTSHAGTGPPFRRTIAVRPAKKANVQKPMLARL